MGFEKACNPKSADTKVIILKCESYKITTLRRSEMSNAIIYGYVTFEVTF